MMIGVFNYCFANFPFIVPETSSKICSIGPCGVGKVALPLPVKEPTMFKVSLSAFVPSILRSKLK